MTDSRRTSLRAAAALSLALALAPAVARAHLSTYDDIWRVVLGPNCNNCHGPGGGAQSGGMIADDGNGASEQAWYNVLVGAKPANGAAAALGKLRVTPYEPWNSVLLDKLTGHLKLGEGRPMPHGSSGYAHTCPGAILKITKWILAGAPFNGYAEGDTVIGNVDCTALAQPAFATLTAPTGGAQLLGDPFAVSGTTTGKGDPREGERISTRTLAADLAVGRIEIVASSGTEYVVVTREGDEAPLAVARGKSLDLTLPEGVAIPLSAGDTITIRQRIRNDHWVKDVATNSYVNRTDGNVAVNLYPAASVDHEATPFIDSTGTQALFVPPRLLGETGGLWTTQSPVNGAMVGIWSDRTVIGAAVADPVGNTVALDEQIVDSLNTTPSLTRSYVPLTGMGLPAGALVYGCTHSNGFTNTNENAATLGSLISTTSLVNRPMKFGCAETAPIPALSVPPGMPELLGGPASVDCVRSNHDPASTSPPALAYNDSECTAAAIDACVPANLVGGEGVNDGRCSLIGLVW
jgi:hypothetical protein